MIVADARDVTHAKAADVAANVIPAYSSDVGSAKAADVASAEAAHVTSAKAAAHMASASAKAATAVASASATTAGLRISGNKAAGKQRRCQDHHQSSHDILLLVGGSSATGIDEGIASNADANVAMDWRWECMFGASTKFAFRVRSSGTLTSAHQQLRIDRVSES
jgi:hypothetical protein